LIRLRWHSITKSWERKLASHRVATIHEAHREEGQNEADTIDELKGAAGEVQFVKRPVKNEYKVASTEQSAYQWMLRKNVLLRMG
jgi:hypothetical protein